MIFLDANIPMYLIGAPHPNRDLARRWLESAVHRRERLVSDVEVLQEILHRYLAIGRSDALQPAFDVLLGLVDEIFPIDQADLEAAKQIALGGRGVSARDALHVAVMRRHGVERVLTFDRDFDHFPGITRLG